MKIVKELKYYDDVFNQEIKTFTIMEADGFNGYIQLDKVYAFAFMRFVVRMAQRNWLRNKKPLDKDCEDVVRCNDQLEMF